MTDDVNPEALDLYMQGLKLYGEDRHAEAVAAYEQALEIQVDWPDAMHGLAMAHMNNGDLERAIEIGKRIIEIQPDDAFAHTSLSIFYQRQSAEAESRGDSEATAELIAEAEKEGAKARMISWKEELKKHPDAPPPGPAESMDVIQ